MGRLTLYRDDHFLAASSGLFFQPVPDLQNWFWNADNQCKISLGDPVMLKIIAEATSRHPVLGKQENTRCILV